MIQRRDCEQLVSGTSAAQTDDVGIQPQTCRGQFIPPALSKSWKTRISREVSGTEQDEGGNWTQAKPIW